jgi:predicted pyridoxine 5'-phosphate oxidase superfamily flavin-nucleotide-binding protein
MAYAFAEIAFTPSVRNQQDKNGFGSYAKFLSDERAGGDQLTERERSFIEGCDGFYQATVSDTGWPYVQFRGGPAGFLHVLGPNTITYADLRGNRQYISLGNLSEDNRISIIVMNYARAERLKIWGRVDVLDPSCAVSNTWPDGTERLIQITVEAIDWNCPRHIPRRLTAQEHGAELLALREENLRLRASLTEIQARLPKSP